MNILESLKACRQFLATADGIQSKSGPICYALTHAFVAKYGMECCTTNTSKLTSCKPHISS